MTNDVIEKAFATETATVAPDATEAKVENAAEETKVESEPNEPAQADKPEENVVFPKKAINAISRRDKQIGKLRAQMQQYQAELNAIKQAQTQAQSKVNKTEQDADAPNPDSYETYDEYMRAVTDYKIEKRFSQSQKQNIESQKASEYTRWVQDRTAQTAQKEMEHAKNIPDFVSVMNEYSDVLVEMPDPIKEAFLHAEDPALAFYTLAREGKLESVVEMTPYQAAIEIGRAQDRGAGFKQSRQATNAPKPISSAKGQGASRKSLDDMSWKELQKNFLNN